MRTFELTARIDAISRGDDRSATAAAAYRACCAIECERDGKTHDYRRKKGLEMSAIVLPAGAPDWAKDRAKLWNAAEMREKNGKRGARAGQFKEDAQVARETMIAFPAELSPDGRQAVAYAVARYLTDTHGAAVDYSLHLPGKDGDEKNYHCHMMMTTRRLGAAGLGEKVREWSGKFEGKAEAKKFRAVIADTMNDQLRREGKAEIVHVEHRSFADRGSGQRPTIHQGPLKTNIVRKEQGRARRAWTAEQKAAMASRQAKERAALKVRQDFALQSKLGELTERQRSGEAAIARDLAAQRAADKLRQETGIRGTFRTLTGKAGREAFEQQARDGVRVEQARQKVETLRAEITIERRDFMDGQRRDLAALTESQAKDTARMDTAIDARRQIDRAEERAMRQPPAQTMERQHERTQEKGHGIGPELSP